MTQATDTGSNGHIASGRRWAMVLGVAVAVIALDQLSKRWALDRLSTGDVIDLTCFNLHAVEHGSDVLAGHGPDCLRLGIGALASIDGNGEGAVLGGLKGVEPQLEVAPGWDLVQRAAGVAGEVESAHGDVDAGFATRRRYHDVP